MFIDVTALLPFNRAPSIKKKKILKDKGQRAEGEAGKHRLASQNIFMLLTTLSVLLGVTLNAHE